MRRTYGLTVLVILACLGQATSAALFNYNVTLDPGQETGTPVISSGTGTALVDYNTDTNLLQWNIVFSSLTGPATLAHFHGPALPGFTAPPVVDIGVISGLTSPMIGSATITEPQEADLLGGLWYVNVHTSQYSAGEIRAQVVPEPAVAGLLAMAAALLGHRRQR